jgi:hypothetical protein
MPPLVRRGMLLNEIRHLVRLIFDDVVHGAGDHPSLDVRKFAGAETVGDRASAVSGLEDLAPKSFGRHQHDNDRDCAHLSLPDSRTLGSRTLLVCWQQLLARAELAVICGR